MGRDNSYPSAVPARASTHEPAVLRIDLAKPQEKARNFGTSSSISRFTMGTTMENQRMRTVHVFAIAIAMAGSAALSLPASAERLCKENCVGPLCNKECVHRDRDLTVGRGGHRDVTIEERRRVREPGVEIRRSRPRGDVEINRRLPAPPKMDGAFSFSGEHQNWIFPDGHR